jgi:hypothetical protein
LTRRRPLASRQAFAKMPEAINRLLLTGSFAGS